jgi:hypothetical protein
MFRNKGNEAIINEAMTGVWQTRNKIKEYRTR